MIDQKNFKIFTFQEILKAASINSYDTLMRQNIGEVISFEDNRGEVRKVSIKARETVHNFYLKRYWQQLPLSWTLKKLLRGKLIHSTAHLELTAINLLRQKNFQVMKPVAWGERRVLTIPIEGFLLVEEVSGKSAEDYWRENNLQLRLRLMKDLGTLCGKLNIAGFFAWVRLKDIICPNIPSDLQQPIPLFLIDRECSKDRLQKFTPKSCYKFLAQCYGYLILRFNPTPKEIIVFIRSYLQQTKTYGVESRKELKIEVMHNLYKLSRQPGPFKGMLEKSKV